MIRLAYKNYCPKCTVVHYEKYDSSYAGYSKNPVLLVKRINKQTKDWFYGCPNFPKCKFSRSRPRTSHEIYIKDWARMNALNY